MGETPRTQRRCWHSSKSCSGCILRNAIAYSGNLITSAVHCVALRPPHFRVITGSDQQSRAETSSNHATSPCYKARTERIGVWVDSLSRGKPVNELNACSPSAALGKFPRVIRATRLNRITASLILSVAPASRRLVHLTSRFAGTNLLINRFSAVKYSRED